MRLVSLIFLMVLAGCSTRQEYDRYSEWSLNDASSILTKESRDTVREKTVLWTEEKRGGAAYNKKGYRHVLYASRNIKRLDDHPTVADAVVTLSYTLDPIANSGKLESDAIDAAFKSYSVYETSRWERFCGDGKMDIKDWNFVAKEGREFVPEQLKENCNTPAYTRQDYISAWQATCDDGKATESQVIIRKSTIRPPEICDMDLPGEA